MNKEFLFGTATAAPQVEGAYKQDGKGKSIWDKYSERGLIKNKQTCYYASDCYNRVDEDIALMKELGINSYRFSLAWPRIQPLGSGAINQKGIDHYSDMIDKLLKNGIKPFITLYHWDLPDPLDQIGGFLNRGIVDRFAEYAKIVAENFGDRVDMFSVFNEAAAIIDFMYIHPVGAGYPAETSQHVYEAIHNLLLANAAATYNLRKYSKLKVKIGMVNCTSTMIPKTAEAEAAAEKHMFDIGDEVLSNNVTFWDPIIFGKYNEKVIEKFKIDTSFIKDGDMEFIACKPDFMGLNIYGGTEVELDKDGKLIDSIPPLNAAYGEMGQDMSRGSRAAYYGPKFMHNRYGLPIVISENGMSVPEWKDLDGNVNDYTRADYIKRYFLELKRAKDDGIDVFGYYVWSFIDNFEWSSGYTRRFGLIFVDYENNYERTRKHSFYAYQKLIKDYKPQMNK